MASKRIRILINEFRDMWIKQHLVDVSLVCQGKIIKAHKVFLSAASGIFKMIIGANPCKHPVIILQDIEYVDLITVIRFIYMGEVSCLKSRLPQVLRAAKTLQIEGLSEECVSLFTNKNCVVEENVYEALFQSEEFSDNSTNKVNVIQTEEIKDKLPLKENEIISDTSSIDLTISKYDFELNEQHKTDAGNSNYNNKDSSIIMPKIVSTHSISELRQNKKQKIVNEIIPACPASKKKCKRKSFEENIPNPMFKITSTISLADGVENGKENTVVLPSTSNFALNTADTDSILIQDSQEDSLRSYRDYLNKRKIEEPYLEVVTEDCEDILNAEQILKYDCPFCFDPFKDLNAFNFHIFVTHIKNNSYKCKLCKKYFIDKIVWSRHVRKSHELDDDHIGKVLNLIKDVSSQLETQNFTDEIIENPTDGDESDSIEIL